MSDYPQSGGDGENESAREEDGRAMTDGSDFLEYSDDFRSLSNESDTIPPSDDEKDSPDPNVPFLSLLFHSDTVSSTQRFESQSR